MIDKISYYTSIYCSKSSITLLVLSNLLILKVRSDFKAYIFILLYNYR